MEWCGKQKQLKQSKMFHILDSLIPLHDFQYLHLFNDSIIHMSYFILLTPLILFYNVENRENTWMSRFVQTFAHNVYLLCFLSMFKDDETALKKMIGLLLWKVISASLI